MYIGYKVMDLLDESGEVHIDWNFYHAFFYSAFDR